MIKNLNSIEVAMFFSHEIINKKLWEIVFTVTGYILS